MAALAASPPLPPPNEHSFSGSDVLQWSGDAESGLLGKLEGLALDTFTKINLWGRQSPEPPLDPMALPSALHAVTVDEHLGGRQVATVHPAQSWPITGGLQLFWR
jgi:hypothetical protein